MKKSDHNLQLGLGESIYDSSSEVSAQVAAGEHRAVVGSLWEELGDLQIKFLISQGLRPSHTLLDVGCGCLRLGVKAIPYLQRGNYFGIDNNASLLEAGMNVELQQIDLKEALPEERLFILPDFEFDKLEKKFDYLIAQSLFSHFTLNRIRRCLSRMIPLLHETSKIFATFLKCPLARTLKSLCVMTPVALFLTAIRIHITISFQISSLSHRSFLSKFATWGNGGIQEIKKWFYLS